MTSRIPYCLAFAAAMTAITAVSVLAMAVFIPLFILQTAMHVATGKTRVGRKDRTREVTQEAGVPSGTRSV